MTHILHLDTSARGAASHSRRVSKELVDALCQKHPGSTVTYRDLGHQAIPHVSEAFVQASLYGLMDGHVPQDPGVLALSNELIAELQNADTYVFGVPMYNFGVPSVFKAYIDHIARAGLTFNPQTYEGLLRGKKMFVVTARGGGGYGPGEKREAYNQQDGQIRIAFGFMGVTDIEFVHVENNNAGDDIRRASLEKAHAKIKQLAAA